MINVAHFNYTPWKHTKNYLLWICISHLKWTWYKPFLQVSKLDLISQSMTMDLAQRNSCCKFALYQLHWYPNKTFRICGRVNIITRITSLSQLFLSSNPIVYSSPNSAFYYFLVCTFFQDHHAALKRLYYSRFWIFSEILSQKVVSFRNKGTGSSLCW